MAYTREEARIKAVQQKWFKSHGYNKPTVKPLEFIDWFKAQLEHFENENVFYEFVGSCIFIQYPKCEMGCFSVDEFKDEYETTYLRQKKPHTCLEGCSA